MSQSKTMVSECNVCGAPASHSYYGVLACESCKMFFKRNAENKKKKLKCHFEEQCVVNVYNRHVCAACRLRKCLQAGMCVERLRCSITTKKKKAPPFKVAHVTSCENLQIQKFTTLNLLEQDQSLLSADQWTLLSNLIHSYDERNTLTTAKAFEKLINTLPPKLRFKIDSTQIIEVLKLFYHLAESFIQSNHHFTSFSSHDRSIALHGAVDNISCLGGVFMLRESELINNAAFRSGLEMTYGTIPYQATLSLVPLLDQDPVLVKLTLSMFAMCTCNCAVFNENASLMYLKDMRSFLHIQDMYAEVVWKYLLYRYTFQETVRRFTRLIQSIVAAVTIRIHLQSVKHHTCFIETIVENIEQG